MGSLQARLHLGLLLSVCILMAGQWWVVTTTLNDLVEASFIDHMRDDTDALLSSLDFDATGTASITAKTLSPAYQQPFSGRYYAIQAGAKTTWSRSVWDGTLPIAQAAPGMTVRSYASGPNHSELLLLTSGFRKQQRDLIIVVAYDLLPMTASRHDFTLRYGAVSMAALVLLILVQFLSVRSALKPLERIRSAVHRLHNGESTVLSENAPREIVPLVREINSLLETLERRLQRSRHAVGDLAHALKTPLAVITHLVEQPALRTHADVQQQLREQISAIRTRMESELARARLAGAGHPASRFRVAEEVPALCRLLEQSYATKGVRIDLDIPDALTLPFDHEDMLELLGNVLDNACKWAKTRVSIAVRGGDRAEFIIEDDGPGCLPELRDQLTQRGRRLDENVAGHGLGLSIVQQIVDDYDGTLSFDTSPQFSGMRVSVDIPYPRGISAP